MHTLELYKSVSAVQKDILGKANYCEMFSIIRKRTKKMMWRRKRKALSYSYLEAAQTNFQPEKSSWTISWWFIRSHKTLVFKNFISLFFWSFHYLVILSCAPLPCEYSLSLALTSNLEDIIFQAFCLGVLKPLPALPRIDRTNEFGSGSACSTTEMV